MTFSDAGLALLKEFEQLRCKAYLDQGGVWTCGYGATINVTAKTTCNPATALAWLARDVASTVRAVNALIRVPLNQNQFDALVSFTYNLGVGALRVSTMRKKILAGDFAAAAAEFPKWDHVKGVEDAGLLTRREREQALFLRAV